MIKSVICDILGIEKPLFQGGMAWIADARLAAAVSNAGGLGLISSILGGPEAVRAEIRKAKELTDKPFGVNVMLADPNAPAVADIVVEEGVTIVTTGAGSPAPYMERWKAAGIRVIPVVASVAYALKMQELGATAVIAEGAESGGHVGDTHTLALLPQILDAVDIPVLAAGGVFDGRSAAAMLLMGACGVQVGTRFLVTGKSLGDAVRSLKTPFAKKFARMEADPAVTPEEIRAFGTGSLRKAVFDGDLAGGSFLAGEVAGLITRKESAADIVNDIIGGAERLLAGAPHLIA